MKLFRRAIMLAILLASVLAGLCSSPALAGEGDSYVPAHGKPIVLFDGSHRDQFDSFLKTNGLNSDPDHVFTFEKDVIHVSGAEMGYLITKKEFADYYLRAEFKWGEATHAPREGQARDSGILYHIQGPNKVWPTSIEYQICEGQTGDFYMTDGAALTRHRRKARNRASKLCCTHQAHWRRALAERDRLPGPQRRNRKAARRMERG